MYPFKYYRLITPLFLLLVTASCTNQTKAYDCQEYTNAIRKLGENAAANLTTSDVQSKQGHIRFVTAMAEGEAQNAQIFETMKVKGSEPKRIQQNIISTIRGIEANWRKQAELLQSLPNTVNSNDRNQALQPLTTEMKLEVQKYNAASREMDSYCGWQN